MSKLNKIIKAHLMTLLSLGISTTSPIALAFTSLTQDDANCFLDWVAYRLPELQLTTVQATLNNGETALREYAAPGFGAGGIFIGVIDSEIFAVHGAIAAGSFMSYGDVNYFIQVAKSENCGHPSPIQYSLIGNYSREECVKDNVTGLIWEGKSSDPSDKRYYGWGYTNYEEICRQTPCPVLSPYEETNSIGYKKYINDIALCGYNNWRLPTMDELKTLIQTGVTPAIDTNWFPNTSSSWYITSTSDVNRYDFSWGVNFVNGEFNSNNDRSSTYSIRLVR